MKPGLEKFKRESEIILENGKFKVDKWESDVVEFESTGMKNQRKILCHIGTKKQTCWR